MRKYPYQSQPAWRNGRYDQVRDLSVSILDLGMIHADATYDVMAIRKGRGFMLDEHIERFIKSCEYWRIPMPYCALELKDVAKSLHWMSGLESSIIWMSASRGVPESGNPRDLENCDADVIAYVKPYQKFNGTGKASVCLAKTVKRVPDTSVSQMHKNFVWPDLTRAQWEAIDRGYDTAILLDHDMHVTEGPGFNIAFVINNEVVTPPNNVLPGITMRAVQKACDELNIPFKKRAVTQFTVEQCEDAFLTTTVGNIATVTNLDGRQLKMSSIQRSLIDYFEGDME